MLDIKYIRENVAEVKKNCSARRLQVNVDRLLELDTVRREKIQKIDELRAGRNRGSKGKPTDEEIAAMRQVGDEIRRLEDELELVETEYTNILLLIPNRTHPESPVGGEEDFRVVETHLDPPKFDFEAKDHETLLTNLGLLDFERGAKVSGAKFYFVKDDLVRLNIALINYGLDIITKYGFKILETPDLAKNEVLLGAGFNPRGEEANIYEVEKHNMSLVGTAEITTLGFHANEILDLSDGPIKYASLSHCFRTEAGAYGRTSKGLYRVHQFSKLEMFVFCKPEESEKLHAEILEIEKEILNGLEVPYRIIDIASADLGAPAYRKYDGEAWMTMKNDYGEVTSTSNCLDFQARRLNIKYRNENNQTDFVHTLNGTGIVTSRFPIILAENFQQADGTIAIPKVLQKYMGKKFIGRD
ncbi:MAG TPA: serine--tRNA ligase [Candidatus Magasanikbacteria bacterium]|nr:serine--tRNA ligase [Candidatus Magasanikbacteria bacterium]